jgi:hypothetical protein
MNWLGGWDRQAEWFDVPYFHVVFAVPAEIEVIALAQEVVRARWSGQGQAWVRIGDPRRQALHRVTGWRPVEAGKVTANCDFPPRCAALAEAGARCLSRGEVIHVMI